MPLTNEGLKVKEELSASLRDGRYLCLNGKLASPPLGAEPSASSSPHPCSAIPGAVSRSSLPTKRVFSGIMAGERGRSQVIWGGAGSSTKLPPVQDHPGEGSHPSPVPDPPCARPQWVPEPLPVSAPHPGSKNSHLQKERDGPAVQGHQVPCLNTKLEQGGASARAQGCLEDCPF